MREVWDAAELAEVSGDDSLVVWAGQGLNGAPIRAWRKGDAVVVASQALARRDRMAVFGPLPDLAPLVSYAFAEVGPSYRPIGDESLVRALVGKVPELEFRAAFGWMDAAEAPTRDETAGWLDGSEGVDELLRNAAPHSYAWPGQSGVRRWAGVCDCDGALLSVAADAWSAPQVGFLAGVATRADARGRGLSQAVCGFLTAELTRHHGRVALMVDHGNEPAIALYRRLGYTYREVAAGVLGERVGSGGTTKVGPIDSRQVPSQSE